MKKTNFVLLTTDQQRVDTLGAYGNGTIRTPNLDALAVSGCTFDRAYTPTAICTPARASLVTGLMPYRHNLLANFERNVGFQDELEVSDTVVPFSVPLREAGYDVFNIGKWHVGKDRGPAEFGFEGAHYPGWGEPVRHPDYLAYLEERGLPPFRVHDEVRGTFPNGLPGNVVAGIHDGPVEGTFSYFLAERAIERIRASARSYRDEGRPFFLALQFFGPHLPYYLPRAYYDLYDPAEVALPPSMAETFDGKPQVQRNYCAHWTADQFPPDLWRKLIAVYWGYVTLIDEQIGRVLRVLEEEELVETTAVAFASDHGAFVGAHRLQDKGPAMYEDIYRIPFLLRLPGAPGAIRRDEFVSLVDVAPTVLSLAGASVPSHYQGRDLAPLARGEEPPSWRDVITAEFHGHHFPYPQRMIRDDRYKLIVNPADVDELYDLLDDPHELRNRIDHEAMRSVRDRLYRRLYRILKDRGDNFHHWMTSMKPVDEGPVDASLSGYT